MSRKRANSAQNLFARRAKLHKWRKQVENVIKRGEGRWTGRDNDLRHPIRSAFRGRSLAFSNRPTSSPIQLTPRSGSHSGLRRKNRPPATEGQRTSIAKLGKTPSACCATHPIVGSNAVSC